MDKEIIIDGVDVSKCEYFQEDGGENTCRAEEDYTGTVVCCSACDNCYYKQLQRLQAEYDDLHLSYAGCKTANTGLQELNNKLQAENDNLKDDIDKQQLYVDSLEQENEELKQQIKRCSDIAEKDGKDYADLRKENEQLKNDIETGTICVTCTKENENCRLQAENERLKRQVEQYKTANERLHDAHIDDFNFTLTKYRQALQEIKTIAEEWMTDYCYLDSFYEKEGCCICHENKDCYSYRLLKTLTKAEEE